MTDKERYATIGTWTEVFREEGANIAYATLNRRLKVAELFGETARNKMGHVIRGGFYAESVVRNLCSDLLEPLPQAGEDGLIQMDGESYGTVVGFSRLLGISPNAIRSRIRQNPPSSIRGKDQSGRVQNFYSLSGIQKLCSDLLEPLPQVGEDGLIQMDGESYGTIWSLSGLLGISENAIRSRIRQNPPPSIRGKDQGGKVCDFYCLSDVRNFCSDLLESLPHAGEDGLIQKDDETYGTVGSLTRLLGISDPTIRSRIRQNPPPSIRGKDPGGHVQDFYSLSDVRALCADLIAKRKTE